jgi:hypothetical protein
MDAAGRAEEWAKPYAMGNLAGYLDTIGTSLPATGLPFKPSIIFFMCYTSTSAYFGFDDGVNHYLLGSYGASVFASGASLSIGFVNAAGSAFVIGFVSSRNSDGFTLTLSSSGSMGHVAFNIFYFAMR